MEPNQDQHYQEYDASDEIDLRKIFAFFWGYRAVLTIAFLGSVTLFGLFFIINYAFPVEKTAAVEFRLEFNGADRGEYPNGMSFDPGDLISTPVLREVYDSNNLEEHMEFSRFRDSIYVLRVESADLLAKMANFRERLSQRNLSAVDRERIEREFEDLVRDSISTTYSLNLRIDNGLPSNLAFKVLTDTLSAWAEDANERMNALNYRVQIFSENIIDERFIEEEDYIIVVDFLIQKCREIIKNANEVLGIPGAELTKTEQTNISLEEIKLQIEDLINYKLYPLIGMIEEEEISKNRIHTLHYLENRLAGIERDSTNLASKANVYLENIRNYSQDLAPLPASPGAGPGQIQGQSRDVPMVQLGESFLDMIMELSGRNQDVEFRQHLINENIRYSLALVDMNEEKEFYSDLIQGFKRANGRGSSPRDKAEAIERFEQRIGDVIREMNSAISWINEIYLKISEENLNPQRGLYSITLRPGIDRERAFDLKQSLAIGFVFIGFVMLCAVLGCFLNDFIRDRKSHPEQAS